MFRITKGLALLLLIVSIFSSCRRNLESAWDTRYITPLITGALTIHDLVPDSLTIIEDDNAVTLVYKSELLDYDLADEAIDIPDTSVTYFVSLDSLTLDDQTVTQNISLGTLAAALPFPYGAIIIAANGTAIPIDPIVDVSTGIFPIDATTFFETATFNQGYLDISVKNGLPVDLTDVTIVLTNAGDGALVAEQYFPLIPAGGVPVTQTTDLAGLTVEGHLNAQITHLSTPGSADPVLIDTSDLVIIDMTARDMELQEAVAIFPDQNLVNNANDVQYDMGGPEFTLMGIEEGFVVIYVVNTIQDSIHIDYNIPYATDETGEHVHIVTTVPPGSIASPTIVDEAFPIAGYTIDLRGSDGNSVNTFYQEFTAGIEYSGVPTFITLDDSLKVIYGLEGIIPSELRGYLGQYDIAASDTVSGISLFDQFEDGEIHFGDINIDLAIDNGLGAGGNVVINQLGGINTQTGEVIYLNCPEVIGQAIPINRALDNPYVPGYTTITMNSDNSNINDLLEAFPDKLFYDVDMHVNPDGNTFNYQDFVLNTSKLNISLNVNMPMAFSASNLTLRDEFDVTVDAGSGTDGIGDIDLTMYADNSFPLDATIKLIFKDAAGNALDSLDFNGQTIDPGEVETTDCRVHTPTHTEMHQLIDGELKDAIINATKAEVTVVFNTQSLPPCSDIVRIYSDYELSFQLTGDINYTFSTSDF
ncbi:MAG: hypothetical protein R2794_05860 [Chitinophagales bacterium]